MLIPLRHVNECASVSSDMYKKVSQYEWYYYNGIAVGLVPNPVTGLLEIVKLHRFLYNVTGNNYVSFKDNNPLNCVRENIEIYKTDKYMRRNNRSDSYVSYKGVTPYTKNRFIARITTTITRINLGIYPTAEDAAKAYDIAAIELYGDEASINLVLPSSIMEKVGTKA